MTSRFHEFISDNGVKLAQFLSLKRNYLEAFNSNQPIKRWFFLFSRQFNFSNFLVETSSTCFLTPNMQLIFNWTLQRLHDLWFITKQSKDQIIIWVSEKSIKVSFRHKKSSLFFQPQSSDKKFDSQSKRKVKLILEPTRWSITINMSWWRDKKHPKINRNCV